MSKTISTILKYNIKKSQINEDGVFPSQLIKQGECIGEAYTLIGQINDKYIAGDTTALGVIHNHCKSPTAEPRIEGTKIVFYALQDLTTDIEITCDYNKYENVINIEKPKDKWR